MEKAWFLHDFLFLLDGGWVVLSIDKIECLSKKWCYTNILRDNMRGIESWTFLWIPFMKLFCQHSYWDSFCCNMLKNKGFAFDNICLWRSCWEDYKLLKNWICELETSLWRSLVFMIIFSVLNVKNEKLLFYVFPGFI